jgi:hypothetical protein
LEGGGGRSTDGCFRNPNKPDPFWGVAGDTLLCAAAALCCCCCEDVVVCLGESGALLSPATDARSRLSMMSMGLFVQLILLSHGFLCPHIPYSALFRFCFYVVSM